MRDETFLKGYLESPSEMFNQAPDGSMIFVFGKGFVSNNIKIIQKIDSIQDALRAEKKFDLDLDLNKPTHVETKICSKKNMSAEKSGVKKVDFKRLLLKGFRLDIAEPIIRTQEDKDWQRGCVNWLLKQEGKMYDYYGLVGYYVKVFPVYALEQVFGWKPKRIDWKWAYYCSELSCEGAQRIPGLIAGALAHLDPSDSTPEELHTACINSSNWRVRTLVLEDFKLPPFPST